MIVRISPIFCLVLALVAASDVSNETDDDDDAIAAMANNIDDDDIAADADMFDISFKVNRLMHDSDDSDDDEDDNDDDDDDDDDDPDWSELWNHEKEEDIPPVFVIILGG